MMDKYTTHCDYCEKQTNKLNGFAVTLGYSTGGWGFRKDFTKEESVEICNECFETVKTDAKQLSKTIAYLKKQEV